MSQKVNNPDNTIAFQGIPGAYSEMACLSNFNTMETLACPSFEQMISSVQDNKAKLAMVPVENSTAGTLKTLAFMAGVRSRIAKAWSAAPESNKHSPS